jgi:hypothetical protein
MNGEIRKYYTTFLIFKATDHFGGFVLSGNMCLRNRKLGQTWQSVIQMLFKIHKCFSHLIDKFARFRHETIVKMENMSREEKFKAMKLPELKAHFQNRGITVNSLPQTRTHSYCLCHRRNEFFIAFSSQ